MKKGIKHIHIALGDVIEVLRYVCRLVFNKEHPKHAAQFIGAQIDTMLVRRRLDTINKLVYFRR